MFRGVSPLSLDSKGRMSMPAKHRERLQELCGGQLVVTIDPGGCLIVYPLPAWEEAEFKLRNLSSVNRKSVMLKRMVVGHAEDLTMDGHGRILLSATLRRFANLTKRAVLVGQGNKLELWDEQKWNELCDTWLDEVNNHDGTGPAGFSELSF